MIFIKYTVAEILSWYLQSNITKLALFINFWLFFQNSTRDALHQRRSSNELNSGVAALAATRSASISVTGSGHVFPTKSDLKAVAGLHQGQQPLPLIPNSVGGGGAGVAGSTAGTGNTDNDSQIREFLSQSELWSLDIFALERLTDHRCLSNLG